MPEVVVMIILFVMLITLQFFDKKKIIIPAKKKKYKMITAIGLCIGMLILFWPHSLPDQLKLIILVVLILNFTFAKEGLGENKIIKSGFLDTNYKQFEKVSIEPIDNSLTSLTFYKRKADQNGTSLEVDNSLTDLKNFFDENHRELIVEFNSEK